MAAKTTCTSATSKPRRKTITQSKAVSNVLPINKYRNDQLAKNPNPDRVADFLDRLSDEHHELVHDYLDVLNERNTRKDEFNKVIQFPINNKRLSTQEVQ